MLLCSRQSSAHPEIFYGSTALLILRKTVFKMGKSVKAGPVIPPTEDSRKKRFRSDVHPVEITGKHGKNRHVVGTGNPGSTAGDTLLQSDFYLDHFGPVSLVLSSDILIWNGSEEKLDIGFMCCCGSSESVYISNQLRISDIYAVESCEMQSIQPDSVHSFVMCPNLLSDQVQHLLIVHSYQKFPNQKATWVPKSFIFWHTDIGICKRWEHQIQGLIDCDIRRPKNLLVIINPHSGIKKALKTWEEVSPLFNRAKINTKVLKTERTRHAIDVLNNATDTELEGLDGVVVVGGDGIFNEVLNGLLLRRHRPQYPSKPQNFVESNEGSNLGSGPHELTSKIDTKKNKQMTGEDIEDSNLSALSVSTDLCPLLETPTECGSLAKSDKTVYTLLSRSNNDADGSINMSKISSSALANCNDHSEAFEFNDGGFVIPSLADECINGRENNYRHKEGYSNQEYLFPNDKFRLGIIPAGSTDSVAVSTTGSRNASTSALHIILGESMPLDVVRLVGWKSSTVTVTERPRIRYAASFAGYGFYGDVIKQSEPSRWMGPLRYDYAGTKVFLQHKLYEAEVSYVEIPDSTNKPTTVSKCLFERSLWNRKMLKDGLSNMICRANCGTCAKGNDYSEAGNSPDSSLPPQKAPRWKHLKGSFISVGAAVISCRNDKAPNGVAATAHLADGLLHLILVKECSRLAYLWHLIELTREDSNPLDFPFVEVYKTPRFNFISHGEESVWNVDGELFPAHQLSAQVFRGLINIFASGPDI